MRQPYYSPGARPRLQMYVSIEIVSLPECRFQACTCTVSPQETDRSTLGWLVSRAVIELGFIGLKMSDSAHGGGPDGQVLFDTAVVTRNKGCLFDYKPP